MSLSNKFISIIIVSYNSDKYLIDCLDSIQNSKTKSQYEVIVVDNASSDNTIINVPPKYPGITFIRNEVNLGFAYANNQGIKISRGNYLLLLNPDTVVRNGALDRMVEFLATNPEAGACGCRILNGDGSLQASIFGFPNLLKEIGHLLRIDKVQWLLNSLIRSKIINSLGRRNFPKLKLLDGALEVDYLLGACLMIKASVIQEVGLLDESLFMYIEDTEICYRIRLNGFGVYYVPDGEIIHYGGKSSETADLRMLIEYTRSRLYFYRKFYGSISVNGFRLVLVLDMIVKMSLVFFSKYKKEMQQLQTRYSEPVAETRTRSYLSSMPDRLGSFKTYRQILKMVIKG